MVSTIALLISVLYWTLLHPAVVEYGFLKVWFFPSSDLGTFHCHVSVMENGFLKLWLFFLGTDHSTFTLTYCCGVQLSKSVAFSL